MGLAAIGLPTTGLAVGQAAVDLPVIGLKAESLLMPEYKCVLTKCNASLGILYFSGIS